LRRRLALATGRPNEAIQQQPLLEAVLPDDGSRRNSRRELLLGLRTAFGSGIRLEPQTAARDPTVRGWLELGILAAQAARGARIAPALASWQSRFPAHPAADIAASELLANGGPAQPTAAPGAHVAVVLPLSGRAAAQAAQIREGLLTAWYASPGHDRPELRFYDSASTPIADLLRTANESGADFIIGPLLREEVLAAAEVFGARPPTLALNFLPAEHPAPADFYQFALSPEDEARQIARRALADGRRRAVVLVPAGDWGQRVLAAFVNEMNAAGGTVLASATYSPSAADHSAAITTLLRISDSRARARRIEAIIGSSVNLQPRRRGDIDFIFAGGPASAARQLRPQLRFHYAGDIPTYATSDSFEPSVSANQDLEGLIFADMPWVLTNDTIVEQVRAALRGAWGEDGAVRSKLFAFGYDAWLLATELRAGRGASLNQRAGLTGKLTVDPTGRVRRELEWAQIRAGAPRLLGPPAPSAAAAPGR
ncbi:MAG: penicillin-binding protein activator, partial [Steroidobacteraceae bacterium]|nr:penicillin-binding protein activator [Steroidobacteraceae bacterium]MDW8258865.1 penicillin-binding protein activator [Gammaproteobacteria bacterium]